MSQFIEFDNVIINMDLIVSIELTYDDFNRKVYKLTPVSNSKHKAFLIPVDVYKRSIDKYVKIIGTNTPVPKSDEEKEREF